MRNSLILLAIMLLAGCMKPSDMLDGAVVQLRDVGLLDDSRLERENNFRPQADSFIYIAQGHFVPVGNSHPRPNLVAEEAFNGFVEFFPYVRRAAAPLGLEQAMAEAKAQGADYLLYSRFAMADDRIGNMDEWNDQRAVDRLGLDRSAIQFMVLEVPTGYLFDNVTVRSRGGLLTFYDNSPEDLIAPALRDYARRLSGFN